jgi:hypothetical protein
MTSPQGADDSEFRIRIPASPGGVHTDLSLWPMCVVTPPSRVMSDADYVAYLEWSRRYIVCVGRPYAMVLDARNVPSMPATQRKLLADHMATTRPFSSRFCAGVAMVYDSMMMRGVMTAIFWLVAPTHPTLVCSTVHEGKTWCLQQLDGFTGRVTQRVS